MIRTRLTSSGLNTGGSFCGSLMCQTLSRQIVATQCDAEQNRTPVMIRLRLQMLAPLSMRCSWKRRATDTPVTYARACDKRQVEIFRWFMSYCSERELQPHHAAWLAADPHRSEDWLCESYRRWLRCPSTWHAMGLITVSHPGAVLTSRSAELKMQLWANSFRSFLSASRCSLEAFVKNNPHPLGFKSPFRAHNQ